jgi:hypothetical protein
MTDIRKLLDSMDRFAGEPEQRVGDQVRGKDRAVSKGKQHPFKNKLVGETAELAESLMLEYQFFIEQPIGGKADNNTSPVANINPPGQGTNPNAPQQAGQAGGTQAKTTNTTQTPGTTPTQTAPTPADQNTPQAAAQNAAQMAVDKTALKKGLSTLQSIAPGQNIDKAVNALTSDPTKLGPADAKALGDLTNNVVEPLLKDPAAANSIRNAVTKLKAK